jgi:IclR family acetate operon transcriptional repressor
MIPLPAGTTDEAPEEAAAQRDPVKTAARTLDVFEAFAKAKNPLTLTELAARLGSPISSCHALVRTLQARGYVYVLDARKRVYPTKRLLAVAQQIAQNDPILERIGPVLDALMRETGETVILGKRQGNVVTYLDVIEGRQTIRYAASPGDTKPLHSSAIGKAMLGVLAEAELARLLKRLPLAHVTANTLTTPAALMRDIEVGRVQGFFITSGENVPEVMAISIARTVGGEPYGVAIAGPVGRLEAGRAELVRALLSAGDALLRIDADLRGGV